MPKPVAAAAESPASFVRAARHAMDLTGEQFGALFERTKGAVSHWEHGTGTPTHQQMARMSALSGVPLPDAVTPSDDGFGGAAVVLLRQRLGRAQQVLPKALLAAITPPTSGLRELAAFMVALEDLLERYEVPKEAPGASGPKDVGGA